MIRKFLLVVLLLCFPVFVSVAAENSAEKPVYTIHDFNIKDFPVGGSHIVSGYVTYMYQCPPCPPPNMCKSCGTPSIVISDINETRQDFNNITEKQLIVNTDGVDTSKLTIGKKYKFTVELKGGASGYSLLSSSEL